MKRHGWQAGVALVAVAVGGLVLQGTPSAQACSCAQPPSQLWAPLDDAPAPRNTRVTVVVPAGQQGVPVLRPVGQRAGQPPGAPVAVTAQRFEAGWQQVLVLSPEQPLAANARYRIAWEDQPQHPRTLVFGTFATGADSDDGAPQLEPVRRAVFHDETVMARTSCQSHERWIEVDVPPASDSREGPLLYGLWLPNDKGRLDLKGPPRMLLPRRGFPAAVIFGATSMCSPLKLKLPAGPRRLPIAVAAVDSAGNRSPARRAVVTIPKGPKP